MPPISIIICARNEAENLKKNLPRILNQNYRSFEVIVVNDQSEDETENILLNFNIKYPILRVCKVMHKPLDQPGKKYALARGIEVAKNDILLLTDADCFPHSEDWLREMQQIIREPVAIGLGYSPYLKHPGWLNRFIRFETVYTATQYFSFALAGYPYMGVGRNLIYKKSLFRQSDGFRRHRHIASGDDDLFVSAVATRENTGIVIKQSAFTYSEPASDWSAYYRQKARHYTTGKYYHPLHQMLLSLLALSHFLHYFGGIVLILKISTMFVGLLYIARLSVIIIVYRSVLKKFHEEDLLPWIPVLDVSLVIYYMLFAHTLFTGNTHKWKQK